MDDLCVAAMVGVGAERSLKGQERRLKGWGKRCLNGVVMRCVRLGNVEKDIN